MLFNSLEYFLFFGVVFFYQWYLHPFLFPKGEKSRRILQGFLLVASYFFYMSWDYRFGALIFISTFVDYFLALKIEASTNQALKLRYLQLSIILNLVCILGFFKYYNFVSQNFNLLFTLFGFNPPLPALQIVLPVGISFFTFQSMSYTIDVYRGQIPTEKSFLKFALFVSFFPQLVAGPIVTARTFLPQLYRDVELEEVAFFPAIRYFLMGYVKKVIISDNISPIVDLIFASPENYGTVASWLASVLFIVQIYCDFSGYSDMAYGSGLLLGYELPENFRMPFLGSNITELWRRWHISLSSWLREYLYFSLGGSRKGSFRHKLNLVITMLLAGLWHGASWNFVIWGGIQGVLLALESSFSKKENKTTSHFLLFVQTTFTLILFIFIGTMFRAESLAKEWIMLKNMLTYTEGGLRPYMIKIGIPAILAVVIGHIFGFFIFEKSWRPKIPLWLELSFYPILVLLISLFTSENVVPFIYFQF